jgi:hypothetical protein
MPGQIAVLGCKAVIAVLLLAAGGAKLADLPAFASTVRLFVPVPALRSGHGPLLLALGIAAGELGAGAVSLAVPQVRWPNLVVLVLCVAFLVVAAVGFFQHRGRSCRCFGALSARGFNRVGIVRASLLVVAALAATVPVPALAVQLSLDGQLGLLAGGALIAGATYTAAAAVSRQPSARGA